MTQRADEHEGDHKGGGDQITVTVTVKLVEGGQDQFKVSEESLVRALRERALAKFDIQPGGATYVLFLNNVRLDDGATLEAAGVKDGSVLLLATEPQVGV